MYNIFIIIKIENLKHEIRVFFGKSIFFLNRKYFIYLENEIGTYIKKISLFFLKKKC